MKAISATEKATKFSQGFEFTIGDSPIRYRSVLNKQVVTSIQIESEDMEKDFEFHGFVSVYGNYILVRRKLMGKVVEVKVSYRDMNFIA